jgi:hypothetical protein
LQSRAGFFYIYPTPLGYSIEPLSDRDSTRCLAPPIRRIYCSTGPLVETGNPPGTKSRARSVSVPIAPLRLSSRRSRSIFIAFKVTTFSYRRGEIGRERAISLTSCFIPIYTIYGLFSTTSGLSVRHTRLSLPGCWDHWIQGLSEMR